MASQPSVCRDCGSTLRWVRMRSGKAMPVNPVADAAGVIAATSVDGGRNQVDGHYLDPDEPAGPDEKRFRPHWADCPRGKEKPKPAPDQQELF